MRVRLNTDAAIVGSGGQQVAASRIVTVALDSTGSATLSLWSNTDLSPSGTVYVLSAFSAIGQLAWQGEVTIDRDFILQEDSDLILLENSTDALLQEQ